MVRLLFEDYYTNLILKSIHSGLTLSEIPKVRVLEFRMETAFKSIFHNCPKPSVYYAQKSVRYFHNGRLCIFPSIRNGLEKIGILKKRTWNSIHVWNTDRLNINRYPDILKFPHYVKFSDDYKESHYTEVIKTMIFRGSSFGNDDKLKNMDIIVSDIKLNKYIKSRTDVIQFIIHVRSKIEEFIQNNLNPIENQNFKIENTVGEFKIVFDEP